MVLQMDIHQDKWLRKLRYQVLSECARLCDTRACEAAVHNRGRAAGWSAKLAQAARCYPHGDRPAQDFSQHHDPALAVCHLVNTFDTRKRGFHEPQPLTRLKSSTGSALADASCVPNASIRPSSTRAGSTPKPDQSADAPGRADWRQTLGRITLTKADEQVRRKQRRIHNGQQPMADF